MTMLKNTLEIIAGGENTRIRNFMKIFHNDLPKHLLPIPGSGHTLLSKLVADSELFFENVQIHAAAHNAEIFRDVFRKQGNVSIVEDINRNGPIEPIIKSLKSNKTVYACNGDSYYPIDWSDFNKFHKSHNLPVSTLIARSVSVPNGAVITTSGHKVVNWSRVSETTETDYINVGFYIFDKRPEIDLLFRSKSQKSDEEFFGTLAKENLLAAYKGCELGFNVNHSETYLEMRNLISQT